MREQTKDGLTIVYRKGEDGFVVAECLQIPGCMSQGKNMPEASKNIHAAIQVCLGVMLEDFIKRARKSVPNLVGIDEQETVRVGTPRLTTARV